MLSEVSIEIRRTDDIENIYNYLIDQGYGLDKKRMLSYGVRYIWIHSVSNITYSKSGTKWNNYEIMNFDEFKNRIDIQKNRRKKQNVEEDPWNEEDWGYVEEKKNNYNFQIGEKVRLKRSVKHEIYGRPILALSNAKGEIGVIEEIFDEDKYAYKVKWKNGFVDRYSKDEIVPALKTTRLLKLSDDPWGEENWGFVKENVSDFEFLKDYNILYSTYDEMFDIAKKLVEIGFDVYGYSCERDNKLEHEWYKWNCFVWSPNKYFVQSRINRDFKRMDYDDFIRITGGAIRKRKLKLEDDPWGEENWGYIEDD